MAVTAETVLLRLAKDFPTDKALRQYLKEHPEADKSKHTVQKKPSKPTTTTKTGPSKPPPIPEAAKLNKPTKAPTAPEAKKKTPPPPPEAKKPTTTAPVAPQGVPTAPSDGQGEAKPEAPKSPEQGRLDTWKFKFKHLSQRAQDFVEKAPKAVKHFLGNPEFRKQTMKEAREAVTSSPKKFVNNLIETAKHEKHEFKLATKGVGKVLSGKKMSKKEKDAFIAVATHMAIAGGAAAAMASGPLSGAALFAKGIGTHIAAKSAHRSLGNIHLIQEMGHIGHGITHLLSHIASEDNGKRDPEKIMAELVMASVLKEMEAMNDDDFTQVLETMNNENETNDKTAARVVDRYKTAAKMDLFAKWRQIVEKHEKAEQDDLEKLLKSAVPYLKSVGYDLDLKHSWLGKQWGGSDGWKWTGNLRISERKENTTQAPNADSVRKWVSQALDLHGFPQKISEGVWDVGIGE